MRPLQLRGDLATAAPLPAVLAALALHSPSDLQDMLAALILSEVIYKRRRQALATLEAYAAALPVPVALSSVQYSRRSLVHPYLLACGDSCFYVCCRGTKELRDFLADGNLILQELEWQESTLVDGSSSSDANASVALPVAQSRPAAHRGFLSRAAGIPVEALYVHARTRGQRLCLCGHSLGGAVAVLCTLRLLTALGPHAPPPDVLRCITFGMPPLGNLALAQHVHANGWVRYITNYALPGACAADWELKSRPLAADR